MDKVGLSGKYKAYPEYKDSGVEWLVDLPSTWEVKRTKAMFRLTRELVGKESKNYQLLSLTLRGVIPRDISDGGGKIPAEFDTYQIVRPNNLIFCLFDIDETPRTIGISSYDGMITGAYNVYSALKPCVAEYAYYYFMHIDSFKGLKPFYTGLRKVVRAETFSNIKMRVPSIYEQQKIANFLDHETAKIDTLIEKQQQLIKLLKEKRQAVISHAVTKGLNPNAPMRDSGVEWLGEVPEHWEVARIKNLAQTISKGTTPSTVGGDFVDEGVRFLKGENIGKSISVQESPVFFITEVVDEQISRSRLEENDVLVIIAGATTGLASILQKDLLPANTNQAVSFIRPKESRYSKLIVRWLSTEFAQRIIWMGAVQAAQPNLSMEDLGNIPIVVPPEKELTEIIEEIDNCFIRFDDLHSKAESAIKLMQERRTALISAAVTGKIDVREWIDLDVSAGKEAI
jgi:type I restriction enzyme S subunit